MAYASVRFSLFSGGQTGAGLLAKYDATGSGGDNAAAVKADNFFSGAEATDAIRKSVDGRSRPTGLPCIEHTTDGLRMTLLNFNAAGTTQHDGGAAWTIGFSK